MSRVFIFIVALFLLITSLMQFFDYNLSNWVDYINLIIIFILLIDALKGFYKRKSE